MAQGFIKLGEAQEIKLENTESCIPTINAEIIENFRKTANSLKKLAPKAEDFLYFSAIMMHAAEAAGLNDDGTPKLTLSGENVKVGWDKSGGTWRWMSNDPSIKPYKNCNGDIFPEEELVKAYKKWVGKPLCIDHKSSSVDHVRGFIVDTYYDRNLKRVVALCALDKAGYPQLARQVSTGVSNCVSMGTAVGKAICSDCAKVARTESDFCDHMRRKSCYGEINIDLNPIELSIVVNGADPKANIKHIIAAANAMSAYVDSKQQELNKLADNFKASIEFTSGNPNEFATDARGTVTNVMVTSKDLDTFKKDVEKAIADFQKLQDSFNNEENMQEHGNDFASNQLSNAENASDDDSGLAPPHARYASYEVGADAISELRKVFETIETKLSQTKVSLDKLANTSTTKQEENMSGKNNINKQGYFQGAGGVNEPTPGQAKYPKDSLNEDLREKGDKHMLGQSPFPEVGSVEGMHPSPDSAETSDELQRKKMLARAESEERAARRTAIVNLAKAALENKTAYFQGGGGVNEPTPGKTKYLPDSLNEDVREKGDKNMQGKKPFPGVGPVDGLYPEDLKRKELLSRANSLRASFVKGATLGEGAWNVYKGNSLVLTASVNELSGGNPDLLHDKIATKEFGTRLLEKVKTHGIAKVASLVKSAQDAAAPPAPAAPAAPAASTAPPADVDAPVEDTGKSGDTKETLLDTAEKARDLVSDVVEGVRALTGEQAEMGDVEEVEPEMGATASFSTASLNTLRKELNGALTTAMKECAANLKDHVQELEMCSSLYDKGAVTNANSAFVGAIVEDALTEARASIADGFKLMTAFVKYARGTKAIVKRAEIEAELNALADGDKMTSDEHDADSDDDLMALLSDTDSDLNDVKSLMKDEDDLDDGDLDEDDLDEGTEDSVDDLLADEDTNDLKAGDLKPETVLNSEMMSRAFESREGRAALRAKLAADALGKQDDGELQDMSKAKFSDVLDQANKNADGTESLDGELAHVETVSEVNKSMMDLAKAPPKVRKEAEAIYKLVSEGKLDPNDLDALVAEGLDSAAVSYYKKYFAQVDGGSEFASELVKEHVKAQMEEELNKYKVKLARSYELAYDMVDRGLCNADRSSVSNQVEEIMQFNDESFDSLKRVVARHPVTNLRKEAGRMPQVGMIGSGEINHASSQSNDDMFAQLSAAFSKTSKRGF